eukprot:10243638-Alexandrium_andersonii.AAC.1
MTPLHPPFCPPRQVRATHFAHHAASRFDRPDIPNPANTFSPPCPRPKTTPTQTNKNKQT